MCKYTIARHTVPNANVLFLQALLELATVDERVGLGLAELAQSRLLLEVHLHVRIVFVDPRRFEFAVAIVLLLLLVLLALVRLHDWLEHLLRELELLCRTARDATIVQPCCQ